MTRGVIFRGYILRIMQKPFFWKARKCWYVKVDRQNVRLDPDETKAFKLWNKMLELADYQSPDASIEAICEAFLAEIEPSTPSKERFDKIVLLCKQFCIHVGPSTRARSINAFHVLAWMKAPKQIGKNKRPWSIARQRDGGQIIKRVFRWAINKGLFPSSDVLNLRLEQPDPRDALISYETHKRLIEETRKLKQSRPFGLVLIALWNSGARPIQIRNVTAWNVSPEGDWIFTKHKSKRKTNKNLIVRPSPCLATLTKILIAKRPAGNLFLTSQGKPWTKDGIARRLTRMKESLGIDEPFTAYSYRHTYTTDALLAGVDLIQVAALLGHSNPAMVAKVYGHVGKHGQPLRAAAANSVAKRHQA